MRSAIVTCLSCLIGIVSFAQRQEASSLFVNSELLGLPSAGSGTVNALAEKDLEVYFEYGLFPSANSWKTDAKRFSAGTPVEEVMGRLQPDQQYYYRMRYRESGATDFAAAEEHTFHTQRARASAFTFAIEADPHMDENSDPDTFR